MQKHFCMMTMKKSKIKNYVVITIIIAILFFCFSCALTSSNVTNSSTLQGKASADTIGTSSSKAGASALPVLPQRTSYFHFDDSSILKDGEIASPSSIKEAVNKIRRPDSLYSDQEKVFLAILHTIMSVAYPSEKITWTIPQNLPENNIYIGAIESVGKGIYDSNIGKADFFSLVVPSLILCLSSSTSNNYYEESEVALKEAILLVPDSVLANYLLGLVYTKKDDIENSILQLQIATTLDSSCFEVMFAYGKALLKGNYTTQAYEISQKLYEMNPQSVDVLTFCAETAFAEKYISSAETFISLALQKEPDNLNLVLLRAKILFDKAEYLSVSSLLDAYAKVNKTNKEYLLLRTKLQLSWNKNTTAAAATIQDALSRYPTDPDVILVAAEIASESGINIDSKSAIELIDLVIKDDKNNIKALEILTQENVKLRHWQEAYESSLYLLQESRSLSVELLHVEICLQLKKITEAESLCNSLYSQYPKDENVQLAYIRVLIASNKENDALKLIETLLPSASSKMKSSLYYERSRLDSTSDSQLADLRASLTSNPRNQEALFALYEYYYKRVDYRKAQYYLRQVIALNNSDPELLKLNADLDELLSR